MKIVKDLYDYYNEYIVMFWPSKENMPECRNKHKIILIKILIKMGEK